MPKNMTPQLEQAFGYIVTYYARIEAGFKYYIATVLDISGAEAAIITAPYTSPHFRNVIRALNTLHTLPNNGNEQVIELLGRFKSFNKIRNKIAHDLWTDGERPGSIKPIGIDIRDRLKEYGTDDKEPDYVISELTEICNDMEQLHKDFITLFKDIGWEDIMARKREEANEAISSSSGDETNQSPSNQE